MTTTANTPRLDVLSQTERACRECGRIFERTERGVDFCEDCREDDLTHWRSLG